MNLKYAQRQKLSTTNFVAIFFRVRVCYVVNIIIIGIR